MGSNLVFSCVLGLGLLVYVAMNTVSEKDISTMVSNVGGPSWVDKDILRCFLLWFIGGMIAVYLTGSVISVSLLSTLPKS